MLNRDTLFSALVSKKTSKSNDNFDEIRLDIPELPSDVSLLNWQIPHSTSYEWIDYHALMLNNKSRSNSNCVDEGFCSSKCSPGSTNAAAATATASHDELTASPSNCDHVWNKALNLKISDYIDWEMRDK